MNEEYTLIELIDCLINLKNNLSGQLRDEAQKLMFELLVTLVKENITRVVHCCDNTNIDDNRLHRMMRNV